MNFFVANLPTFVEVSAFLGIAQVLPWKKGDCGSPPEWDRWNITKLMPGPIYGILNLPLALLLDLLPAIEKILNTINLGQIVRRIKTGSSFIDSPASICCMRSLRTFV